MKLVPYKCFGWGYGNFPQYNWVAYLVLDHHCIFSGVQRQKRTSTVSAASEIIENIAAQEHTHWSALQWFDLHTHWGYPHLMPTEYRMAALCTAYANSGKRPRSEKRVVFIQSRVYVIVHEALEVKVEDCGWALNRPDFKPIFDVFRGYIRTHVPP